MIYIHSVLKECSSSYPERFLLKISLSFPFLEDNNYIKVITGRSSCICISVRQKLGLETLNIQILIKGRKGMILQDLCDKLDILKGFDTFLPWFQSDPVQS